MAVWVQEGSNPMLQMMNLTNFRVKEGPGTALCQKSSKIDMWRGYFVW